MKSDMQGFIIALKLCQVLLQSAIATLSYADISWRIVSNALAEDTLAINQLMHLPEALVHL